LVCITNSTKLASKLYLLNFYFTTILPIMINNQELKEKLPHGFGKVVAEKAGVNEVSVSRFLNGKTNSWKIEKAALEVIAELQSTRINISNLVKG
jgi:hypothetical protein